MAKTKESLPGVPRGGPPPAPPVGVAAHTPSTRGLILRPVILSFITGNFNAFEI